MEEWSDSWEIFHRTPSSVWFPKRASKVLFAKRIFCGKKIKWISFLNPSRFISSSTVSGVQSWRWHFKKMSPTCLSASKATFKKKIHRKTFCFLLVFYCKKWKAFRVPDDLPVADAARRGRGDVPRRRRLASRPAVALREGRRRRRAADRRLERPAHRRRRTVAAGSAAPLKNPQVLYRWSLFRIQDRNGVLLGTFTST